MRICRNRVPREEAKRMADAMLAKDRPFAIQSIAAEVGVNHDALYSRLHKLGQDHGMILAQVTPAKPRATEPQDRWSTVRLTRRGRQVMQAMSDGVAVPPPLPERAPKLTLVEEAYRTFRADIVIPEEPQFLITANPTGRCRHLMAGGR